MFEHPHIKRQRRESGPEELDESDLRVEVTGLADELEKLDADIAKASKSSFRGRSVKLHQEKRELEQRRDAVVAELERRGTP